MLPRYINTLRTAYLASFNGLSKGIYLLATMMLLNRMGTLILPFLTLYTTQELTFTTLQAGTASACFGIGGFCGAYLGGVFTDRFGSYKTMLISLIGATIAFFVLKYISDYYLFCVVLFLGSLLADILRPAVMSCVRLYSTEQTQTRALSLMRMAFNLGFALGPALAGVLIVYFSFSIIFVVDSLTCLLAAIFLVVFLHDDRYIIRQAKLNTETDASNPMSKTPYVDGPFLVAMLMSMLMLISFFQFLFTAPLYLKEVLFWDEGMIGIFFAVNGALIFILEMPLVHYVERRYPTFNIMIIGCLMIGAAIFILLGLHWGAVIAWLYMILISVGEIINFPFISSIALRRSSDHNSGQYMAVVSMMFSLSLIISPKLGTYILDTYGYDMVWIVMTVLCAISAIGLQWVRSRMPHCDVIPKEEG